MTCILSRFVPDLGQLLLLLDADRAVRARHSTVNGPATGPLVVLVRLVEERLGLGVPGDRRVDLLARHAFLDVRVVGDDLERDVRHTLVDEALADVALRSCTGGRCRLTPMLLDFVVLLRRLRANVGQ